MGSLQLNNIKKNFGQTHVLRDINLDVKDGEFVIFVGPSGCGKSTLLRIIAGLEDASSGDIRIDGSFMNQVPPAKRGIAMVFQSYALYPHMTVKENMSAGLKQAGALSGEIETRVSEAARMLSLQPYLQRRPSELSGGQRQRVAIGRAVVREPSLFLFDEPLSNLDAALRVATRLEIARLHRDLKATMIYVTHDQVEAMTLADKIVVMNGGHIEQVGSPMDLYNNPANLFVAGFIGSPQMNFLPADGMPGTKTLGVRPEHLLLSKSEGRWQGQVTHVEHLGADTNIYLAVNDTIVTVRAVGEVYHEIGETLSISATDDQRIYHFDDAGQFAGRG